MGLSGWRMDEGGEEGKRSRKGLLLGEVRSLIGREGKIGTDLDARRAVVDEEQDVDTRRDTFVEHQTLFEELFDRRSGEGDRAEEPLAEQEEYG